jgi:hypothetical protein
VPDSGNQQTCTWKVRGHEYYNHCFPHRHTRHSVYGQALKRLVEKGGALFDIQMMNLLFQASQHPVDNKVCSHDMEHVLSEIYCSFPEQDRCASSIPFNTIYMNLTFPPKNCKTIITEPETGTLDNERFGTTLPNGTYYFKKIDERIDVCSIRLNIS